MFFLTKGKEKSVSKVTKYFVTSNLCISYNYHKMFLVFWLVLQGCLAFNMESVAWKYLSSPAAGFGYQVVIRDSSRYEHKA